MNLFETATRNRYRFPYRGMISVEDLWTLRLEQLDEVYKTLNAEKSQKMISVGLISNPGETGEETELMNKLAIIRYIFNVKNEEQEMRKKDAENREKKERILALLKDKQDESLKAMSEEELKKMLEEL